MGVSAMRRRKRGPSDSDSDSDYHDGDDEDFSAVSRKKSKPRKKLALPKHPKNSSRRDIKEQGRRVDEDAIDVVDSEDDRIANNKSQSFQTLLDAVFDNSGESLAPLSCHLSQNEGQAESMHVERAVLESLATLNVDKKQQKCSSPRPISVNKDGVDGFDVEDVVRKRDKSQECQLLLLGIGLEKDKGEGPVSMWGSLMDGVHNGGSHKEIIEGQTLVLPQGIKEGICSSKQDTQDISCSEEEQDEQDEDYCIGMNDIEDDLCSEEEQDSEGEDCHAVNSDGLERPKLKQKSNKNATRVALEPGKMDFMVTHVKKVRSMLMYKRKRTVSENIDKHSTAPAMASDKGKNSSELSSIEPPQSEQAGHVGEYGKEHAELSALKSKSSGKSASVKTPHSLIITKRFGATPVGGLKNVPFALPDRRTSLKSNKESSWESISSDSPNAKIMQYQSSLIPHQRVIGLSRRVRPAPLHPYLLKSDT